MYVLRQVWVILILIAAIACPAECQDISTIAAECINTLVCPCCSLQCPSDGSGMCDGNCKDGYHGGKCYNKCPYNCIRCVDAQQVGANCTLCRDGYFSTASLYQCQSACSSNCKTCESSADKCTSCQDGYYLSESYQCVKCNETCVTCKSSSSCTSCSVGFYKVHEQCQQCNPLCYSCNSSDTCFCSNGCKYSDIMGCHGETNICVYGCRPNFTSKYETHQCDQCVDGNYGIECNLQCKATCEPAQCERLSGTCSRCMDGLYGDTCEMICPNNCQLSCDRITGQCNSCKRGFYGINCTFHCPAHCQKCTYTNGRCTTCVRGFYGDNCEVTCPENCQDGACTKTDGSCFSCMTGFMGLSCEVDTTTTMTIYGIVRLVQETPQNFDGAAVGITLAAVATIAALVGVGLWCYRKRNRGISSGNRSLLSITSHMLDIEKVEKEMASIDLQLIKLNTQSNKLNTQSNKLTSRRSELEAKLETLRNNIPYRNTNLADIVEDKSYEMLQREKNESQYSTLQ